MSCFGTFSAYVTFDSKINYVIEISNHVLNITTFGGFVIFFRKYPRYLRIRNLYEKKNAFKFVIFCVTLNLKTFQKTNWIIHIKS